MIIVRYINTIIHSINILCRRRLSRSACLAFFKRLPLVHLPFEYLTGSQVATHAGPVHLSVRLVVTLSEIYTLVKRESQKKERNDISSILAILTSKDAELHRE